MLFRNRKYKSGTKFCLWRWTDVDSKYIVRLHLIKTPWFAVCLHWILKPDPEPWLHDHPVSFLSVILRGWYIEDRSDKNNWTSDLREHKWFNWISGTYNTRHSIVLCSPNTLTLCFVGPKRREWGFHTDKGWVYWKDYYASKC